jgi:hypothetical protein
MHTQNTIPACKMSFEEYLREFRQNKYLLWLIPAALVIQFAIFKYLYPYASYIHGDSFSYITAAYNNQSINTYPIGYSKFLRLFSVFAKPDYFLVTFQYLFIQCSALFLLFTIFYFYKPGKLAQYVLLGFMMLNPLFLHLANLVSSDCLFVGLSLIWFSLLLWIIHQPSRSIIIWHAIVLFIAFTVRYNAIVYPLIAILAFWISGLPIRKKITGVLAAALLCGLFVCFKSYQYKKLTGHWQFSPFTGWLMANNAMYAFRYVDSAERKPSPKKFQALDNMVRKYFDSTRNPFKHPQELLVASTAYMWTKKLTLYKYRDSLLINDTISNEFKRWASMGPFYKQYGFYIIKKYPWHFAQYYLGPNALKYYTPPLEFLGEYNSGEDTVTKMARVWFGYRNQKVKTRLKENEVWSLNFYPILSGIINAVMLCTLIYFLILKGWNSHILFSKGILIGSVFWLLNAAFTIFVSSAALRFQSFPIILTTSYVVLLIDWMIHLMRIAENKEKHSVLGDEKPNSESLSNATI